MPSCVWLTPLQGYPDSKLIEAIEITNCKNYENTETANLSENKTKTVCILESTKGINWHNGGQT